MAAGASGGKTGTYTLSVTPPSDDFTAGTDTGGAIDLAGGDASVTGEVESWGDRDWFAVTLVAGRTYQLDLKGSATRNGEFGTLADPYLYGVHDADGVLVSGTADDNGGWGANSRMTFMPPASGTWYVAVGGVGNDIGTYTLRARVFEDDFTDGTDTAGAVAVGGSATGDIDYRGDRDWFAVTLESGKDYLIDLTSGRLLNLNREIIDRGTLTDPYLHGIHDAAGNLIDGTADDNGGTYLNSRVSFTAAEDGTYYLAAGAAGNGLGDYTLSVEEVL